MKVYLLNRKDVRVFQELKPLKVYCEDGREYVVPKLDEGGRYQINFVKTSEFDGAGWFLKALFFWIIGIMGIFTPRYAKVTHTLDCKLYGSEDEDVSVNFISPNGKCETCTAVKIKDSSTVEKSLAYVEDDKYVVDFKASKRKKIYRILSAVARIAVIAILAVVIIYTVIG